MAQMAGIQDFGRITYKELYVRWQIALKMQKEPIAQLTCAIDNAALSIIHSIPFIKHRGQFKPKQPSDYLPWKPEKDDSYIRLDKDDFGKLRPLVTGKASRG